MSKMKNMIDYITDSMHDIDLLDNCKPYLLDGEITKYFVSENGSVYSIHNNKIKRMTPQKQKHGYYLVHLHKDGKSYYKWLHRMVAECFIPNPFNKPEVNHKDGDKNNNTASNLEWVTSKENIQHAFEMNLRKNGEESSNASITEKDAINICKMLESNMYTMKEISEIIGCTYAIIFQIHKKQTWVDVSNKFNIDNFNRFEKPISSNSISKEMVINICEDLQNTSASYKILSEKYNVSEQIISCIKRRITWKDISKNYDFSNRN